MNLREEEKKNWAERRGRGHLVRRKKKKRRKGREENQRNGQRVGESCEERRVEKR